MYLSVDDIILGIITISIGMFVCLCSIRATKVVMFFVGFLLGYFICQMLLSSVDIGDNPDKDTITIVATLVSGIAFGFLVLFMLHVGLFILGAIGGFFTAIWVLSFLPDTSILQEPTYSGLFIGFFVLFFCIISYFFKDWILIICSSIIGSYVTFYGIDRFTHFGYYEMSQNIFVDDFSYTVSKELMAMLLGNLTLAIAGFVTQAFFYAKQKKKDKQYKKLDNNEQEDEERL